MPAAKFTSKEMLSILKARERISGKTESLGILGIEFSLIIRIGQVSEKRKTGKSGKSVREIVKTLTNSKQKKSRNNFRDFIF